MRSNLCFLCGGCTFCFPESQVAVIDLIKGIFAGISGMENIAMLEFHTCTKDGHSSLMAMLNNQIVSYNSLQK